MRKQRSARRFVVTSAGTLLMVLLVTAMTIGPAPADQAVQDLSTGTTPTELATVLAGSGVTVSNVTFVGSPTAAGLFSGFPAELGFTNGVVLSTGQAVDAVGPNDSGSTTTEFSLPGDPDLTTLSGVTTHDATFLQFDFSASSEQVTFDYVFGSDEYNEFANSSYNDVFAFFVNGNDMAHNCAVIDGRPVSVNSINGGNPLGTDAQNSSLFRNNDTGALAVEADGLTTVLKCTAAVVSGGSNTMRLAIADGSDYSLDSWVFIRAGSFAIVVSLDVPDGTIEPLTVEPSVAPVSSVAARPIVATARFTG